MEHCISFTSPPSTLIMGRWWPESLNHEIQTNSILRRCQPQLHKLFKIHKGCLRASMHVGENRFHPERRCFFFKFCVHVQTAPLSCAILPNQVVARLHVTVVARH